MALAAAAAGEEGEIPLPNPRLWSPDDPFLYDLTVTLEEEKEVIDRVEGYCGVRKISSGRGKHGHETVMLNNKPLFLHGPLDQGTGRNRG